MRVNRYAKPGWFVKMGSLRPSHQRVTLTVSWLIEVYTKQKESRMNKRNLLITLTLVSVTFLIAGCGTQKKIDQTARFTEIPTSVPPSKTPTITSSPEPTITPTFTPTPIGGLGGLLLYRFDCKQDGICEPKIFLYDLISHKLIEFLNGYAPLDVAPDGRKVLLLKYTDDTFQEGDLYLLDLQEPEKLDLLQENVNNATWLGNSDWIGFVSAVNGKRQGFIAHPDGRELTQVTNSTIGVAEFEPVFHEGFFWKEGIVGTRSIQINANKWTKLDKTELQFTNFEAVTADGKYVITRSMDTSGFELMEVETGEIKEISLSQPDENPDYQISSIRPISQDKWLVGAFSPTSTFSDYWIYSSDGTLMAKVPTEYRILSASDPPESYDLLSPDAVWILIQKFEKISGIQYNVTCCYLFNTLTSEITDIPTLHSVYPSGYFWVKIP
jgi:hypothetical protein